MTSDDADLIRQACGGSDAATATLFDRAWPDALRAARAILGRTAFAEDVAQESIVSAFARLPSFDHRRPFSVWLRRIVVNRALNSLRDNRRLVALETTHPAPAGAEPAAGGALARAVQALPDDRRLVIALRYGLDLSPPEIAELTDVPVGTVKSRLARALDDLREALHEVARDD